MFNRAGPGAGLLKIYIDMEYEITQIRKYGKGRFESEWIGVQWYNLVYFRVYPEGKQAGKYYKLHLIHMFDSEDLWEFYRDDDDDENRAYTEREIKACRDELIFGTVDALCNTDNIQDIVEGCNTLIKRYF